MKAWAAVVDGEIDIRTVMPTEVGAMLCWLVVYAGAAADRNVPDEKVRTSFNYVREQLGADVEVCPVDVRRVLQ